MRLCVWVQVKFLLLFSQVALNVSLLIRGKREQHARSCSKMDSCRRLNKNGCAFGVFYFFLNWV